MSNKERSREMKTRIAWALLATSLAAFGCGSNDESAGAESLSAVHSWGNYHWARTSNPFTLQLGDNLTSNWDSYLATTSSDWSQSSVLDTPITTGSARPRNCRPTAGRVEVCNSTYGNNGWLGIAQIWASGSHITQGVTKVNDTYFNTATYDTPAWRNLVLCQEVGHTLGLDHQDENFDNRPLGTCMDYSADPTQNQHPNRHDYEQLETIYAHTDNTTTVGATTVSGSQNAASSGVTIDLGNGPEDVGAEVATADHWSLFEKHVGQDGVILTSVIWAN
jgi:hypothetical protein